MNGSWRLVVAGIAVAGSSAKSAAQTPIPVRSLTPAAVTDSGLLKTVVSIRPLKDGRVLVNDQQSHRVLLFDSTMKHYAIVLDSGITAANRYAVQVMDITPYLADSTLLLDVDAQAFVVVTPAGTVARTMALPFTGIINMIPLLGAYNTRGFDPQGRLVYRRIRSSRPAPSPSPASTADSGKATFSFTHDSMAIMRINLDTKVADTLALTANPTSKTVRMSLGNGFSFGSGINPFPTPDEWTLLPDGTVAIVRGHDYHVDWVTPDGKVTATPKMAFDWKKIPDEEKQRMSDSLRKAAEARYAGPVQTTTLGGGPPRTIPKNPPVWFEPSEMADYYPPIRANTVKSDPEGNVWVLPTTSVLAGSGLVYDLVNRKGEVFERVRLPEGRNLVAVGANGVVYMSYTPKGWSRLERAIVQRQ